MYVTSKNQDEGGKSFEYVKAIDQQNALMFLTKQVFETPRWLIEKDELAQFDNGVIIERIKTVQTDVLTSLLEPTRLARLYDAQIIDKNHAYCVPALFGALRQSIFKDASDPFQRNLQRCYIKLLSDLLDSNYKFDFDNDSPDRGNTPINVSLSDIKPMVRAELEHIKANIPKSHDPFIYAHYKDILYRINKALDSRLAIAVSKN